MHLLSSHLNQSSNPQRSQATQMCHLPGKQFHSSHWIAENNDLFFSPSTQLLWGGCLGVFTSSPGSSETFSMGPNRIKKTQSIRCTKGSVSLERTTANLSVSTSCECLLVFRQSLTAMAPWKYWLKYDFPFGILPSEGTSWTYICYKLYIEVPGLDPFLELCCYVVRRRVWFLKQ